jgi:hypothetical protein
MFRAHAIGILSDQPQDICLASSHTASAAGAAIFVYLGKSFFRHRSMVLNVPPVCFYFPICVQNSLEVLSGLSRGE